MTSPTPESPTAMTAPSDATVLPIRNLSERAAAPRFLRLNREDNLVVSIDPILPARWSKE